MGNVSDSDGDYDERSGDGSGGYKRESSGKKMWK